MSASAAVPLASLPVTLIGGYLGSGKTTLVNHLLRHAGGRRLVVLVNEFGSLPIDEDLIEARSDALIALAGGCVCCSYGDDLTGALIRLRDLDPMPDQVLLECSGVALPHAIAASLSLVRGLHLGAIVVLADAETVQQRLGDRYIGATVRQQFEAADLLVIGKGDLIGASARAQARDTLSSITKDERILEAIHGRVDAEVLFGLDALFDADLHHHTPGSHAHHHSVARVPEEPLDVERLAQSLVGEPSVMRAKGFVRATNGTLRSIQVVGERRVIGDAPESARAGLVGIGVAGTDTMSRGLAEAMDRALDAARSGVGVAGKAHRFARFGA